MGQKFDPEFLKKTFYEFDEDGSGAIEKEEMCEFLDVLINPKKKEEKKKKDTPTPA